MYCALADVRPQRLANAELSKAWNAWHTTLEGYETMRRVIQTALHQSIIKAWNTWLEDAEDPEFGPALGALSCCSVAVVISDLHRLLPGPHPKIRLACLPPIALAVFLLLELVVLRLRANLRKARAARGEQSAGVENG